MRLPCSYPLRSGRILLTAAAAFLLSAVDAAHAEEFRFGSSANGLNGLTTASITEGAFTMSLTAGPAGAVLNETGSSAGLGVASGALPDIVDGAGNVFDVLDSPGPLGGAGEYLDIVFSRKGMITSMDFDGVSDDALEYFVLTTAGGERVNFFDLDANNTVAGAVDLAVAEGVVTGEVVYMRDDSQYNDEVFGLSIPVGAGEAVRLQYAQLPVRFGPVRPQNGSRFQGLTIRSVPEPTGFGLAIVGAACGWRWRNRGLTPRG